MTRLMAMVVGLSSTVVGGCVGYFGPAGPGGASDVPCFDSTEWSDDIIDFAFREDALESEVMLFTAQTRDQGLIDVSDGSFDYVPHEAVYRFDPVSGEFKTVEAADWDEADSEFCDGCGDAVNEGPFVIEDWKLQFNGGEVSVAGRRAVNIFDARISTCVDFDAPTVEAVAVLSIDGNIGFLGDTTGQHYHQLFSKVDGSQIDETQRLGMGGAGVHACWSVDEKYVIYHQGTERIADRICVVPVANELAGMKGQ